MQICDSGTDLEEVRRGMGTVGVKGGDAWAREETRLLDWPRVRRSARLDRQQGFGSLRIRRLRRPVTRRECMSGITIPKVL